MPSSGADEWVVARDGHSGRQVVALYSETRSRSSPDAVEYGGWVFSCGKRTGRITTSYPDPAGSSESAPMAYVCCYEHGPGCGKWAPMTGDVDRASLLRWLRAWRFYSDSAAHQDALKTSEAYQTPHESLAVLPDDVPHPVLDVDAQQFAGRTRFFLRVMVRVHGVPRWYFYIVGCKLRGSH